MKPRRCEIVDCTRSDVTLVRDTGRELCGTHRYRLTHTGTTDKPPQRERRTRCDVEGCVPHPNAHFLNGMCGKHDKRMRKTGSTDDPVLHLWSEGDTTKWCNKCGEDKPLDSFYPAPKAKSGRAGYCKDCVKDYYGNRSPGHIKHGVTAERFAAMIASQEGRCANPGCRTESPGGHGTWHVDHDHACCPGATSCGACVRGLLCSSCNTGMGMFSDSIDKLLGAIDYLRKCA